MLFGVALNSTDVNRSAFAQSTGWMFAAYSGELWNNNVNEHCLTFPGQIKSGDVISVQVNMLSHSVTVFVNGQSAGAPVTIQFSATDRAALLPAFELRDQGESLEFL